MSNILKYSPCFLTISSAACELLVLVVLQADLCCVTELTLSRCSVSEIVSTSLSMNCETLQDVCALSPRLILVQFLIRVMILHFL